MILSTGVSVCVTSAHQPQKASQEFNPLLSLSRVPHYRLRTGLHHCQTVDEWDAGKKKKILIIDDGSLHLMDFFFASFVTLF